MMRHGVRAAGRWLRIFAKTKIRAIRPARLTIGIPTMGNRPDRLLQAIESALAQGEQVIVLVADQTGDAEATCKRFRHLSNFRYVRTNATCLWENWCAAAEAANTEWFAWLQDDDVVASHLAERVRLAFDNHPECVIYLGRCAVSTFPGLANWWQTTGPMVPMGLLHGGMSIINARLVISAAYFHSLALSPAMAFRLNKQTLSAIRRCPLDCDLFVERIVLAEMIGERAAICDPAVTGVWVQHEGNESKKQLAEERGEPQFEIMRKHIDAILRRPEHAGWPDALGAFAMMVGSDHLKHWLNGSKDHAGLSVEFDMARQLIFDVAAHLDRMKEESKLLAKVELGISEPPDSQPNSHPLSAKNGRRPGNATAAMMVDK